MGQLGHADEPEPTAEEDEFDPFAEHELDPVPDEEGDDSVHAGGDG